MINVAFIGGSGIYLPEMLSNVFEDFVETPYGSVKYSCGEIAGKKIAFIPRHGKGHRVPPHKINYRANIWGLKKIGVKHVVSSTAVGSLNDSMKVGEFVIPDQILDFSKSRINTFFDGEDGRVVHVDVTNPYCQKLGKILFTAAKEEGIISHPSGTYVSTEGPRFETAAEIKMYKLLGGDIVGMTGIPEATLAREAELCYATFSLVTNLAAGISATPLSHQEVYDCMQQTNDKIKAFLKNALVKIADVEDACDCQSALQEFGGF